MPLTHKTAEQKITKYWEAKKRLPDFLFLKEFEKKFPDGEVFLVGGAVRDIILERKDIIDFDFVVRNVPAKKLNEFIKEYGKINLVGKKFGVYKFVGKLASLKEPIDIALPRTESSIKKSGAHRDFKISSDPSLPITADLSRRDFTINAMAYDVFAKKLIDPFQGIADLAKKRIDTVGIPKRRFGEDLARILRALRFSSELDMTIEERVWKTIKSLAAKINAKKKNEWIVPREVLAKELLKSFLANPVKAFDLYYESGLTKILMPELLKMQKCPQPKNYHTEGDVWTHARLALSKLNGKEYKKIFPEKTATALVVMGVLFHDIAKPLTIKTPEKDGTDRIRFNNHDVIGGKVAEKIAKRLALSSWNGGNVNPQKLSWLIEKHLLLVHGKVDEIANRTLEKYFLNPLLPGEELLELFFADGAATIPTNGKADLTSLKKLLSRLKGLRLKIKSTGAAKNIINGHDIMKEYKLKPGPQIGELLEKVREEHLSGKIKTKKEALSFVKRILSK